MSRLGRRHGVAGLALLLVGLLGFWWVENYSPLRREPLVGGVVAGEHWQVRAWRDLDRKSVCAGLFIRYTDSDGHRQWSRSGTEACAWAKTSDGSGWVRDGGAEQVRSSGEWVFYGVVPEEGATVRLTLPGKGTQQVATFSRRGFAGRFYVIHQPRFSPSGNDLNHARLVLLDASGKALNVY